MSGRLHPVPDENSAPFWAACAEHRLTLACCAQCGGVTLPPDITCPHCRSTEPAYSFKQVSGRGRVRTWTILRQSYLAGFKVPFVLVDVELDDAPDVRLIGQLLDGPEARLAIGDAVEVAFEDLAQGVAVPAFKLVRAA